MDELEKMMQDLAIAKKKVVSPNFQLDEVMNRHAALRHQRMKWGISIGIAACMVMGLSILTVYRSQSPHQNETFEWTAEPFILYADEL
jgi:hypothetical protein